MIFFNKIFNYIRKYISFNNPIYYLISKNSTFKTLIFLKHFLRKNEIILNISSKKKAINLKKNINDFEYYNSYYRNEDYPVNLFNDNYLISYFVYFVLILITRKFYFILYFLKPTFKKLDVICTKLHQNPIVVIIDIDDIKNLQNIIRLNIYSYPYILLIRIKNSNKKYLFEINSILESLNFYPYDYNPVTRILSIKKSSIFSSQLIFIRDFDLIKERLIKSNKIKIFNFYF